MAQRVIYTLPEGDVTVSGGGQLSGINQGDGSHLVGRDITLNSTAWESVTIDEADGDTGFGDSDNSQNLAGPITYDGESYGAGRRVEAEFSFTVEDPDGNTYDIVAFNINEPGVTSYATVEGLAFVGGPGGFPPAGVPLRVIAAQEGPNVAYDSLATPICFVAGGRVATPTGPRAVEEIGAGDLVLTRDAGAQPVLWAGRMFLPAAALAERPDFAPIRVARGAFGSDAPHRDVWLSPQHRVLVTGWRAELYAGADEVLVPVKKLVGQPGITADWAGGDVTYVHLLLDHHALLDADGLIAESLLPAAATGVDADLVRAFAVARAMPAARPVVCGPAAALLRPAYSGVEVGAMSMGRFKSASSCALNAAIG
ncbi:MAG: Hint domain-containing protein [Pseudomonadota bacterium]